MKDKWRKRNRISVDVDPALRRQIQRLADEENRKVSNMTLRLIQEALHERSHQSTLERAADASGQ